MAASSSACYSVIRRELSIPQRVGTPTFRLEWPLTRCTHSASRRRRSTASPSGSGSGSVWGPWTCSSSRRGRLPAERFFRGATALQGSGAATVAAMPLTSPLRARAAAAQLVSRHTSHVNAKPLEAGGGTARDRGAAERRYRVLGCCRAGRSEPGLPAGGWVGGREIRAFGPHLPGSHDPQPGS